MKKNIKKDKDIEKDSKGKFKVADFGKVSTNGDFYFNSKLPFYIKLTWILDGIFNGLVYLTTATIGSFYLDKYAVKSLDKGDSKFFIFIQFCGEVFYLVVLLYVIVIFYGKFLPSIAIDPPTEHRFLKNYICGFCTVFGLFITDPKLNSKIRYVLGP